MLIKFTYVSSIIITFFLTLLVLLGGIKNKVNLFFLLFMLSVICWIGSLFLFYNLNDPITVLILGRFNFVATIFLITLVFYFSYFFPEKIININKKVSIALWVETIVLAFITFFTPLVDKEEIISAESRITVYGHLYFLFIIHFLLYFLASIYLLHKKYRSLQGKKKLQIRFVLFGLGLAIFFGAVTNIFIPLISGYYDSQNFGVIAPVILSGFISYAIRKHRLMNIKVIATEVLTFVIWAALAIKIFFVTSYFMFVIDFSVLILTVFFGVLLINSVRQEVEQKEKLKELNLKLQSLDKQKDEFISMAAHELRAPMTAIKGYISMVVEGDTGDIPEKARGFLADAGAITDRLVRLVNNMLNVSRIEEGRIVYQMEEENLSNVTRAVFNQFAPEVERKGLEYTLEMPREIKDRVAVDPDRIQEVIGNLISNAVKYTDSGFVKVKLLQPNQKTVRCEVVDSGSGISLEEQKKLFQKFHRVETNIGKTTGSGLGLYICKLLIEKFNGQIGIVSDTGKGSTFWFELPLVTTTLTSAA